MNHITVIGGGASGLAAAIAAAREGAAVTILEHTGEIGKKLLATGNGRCNFTNRHMTADCYFSENPPFVAEFLKRFSVQDCLDWFGSLGVYAEEKNGYVYPYSNQAVSVVEALKLAVAAYGIEVRYRVEVTELVVKKEHLVLRGTETLVEAPPTKEAGKSGQKKAKARQALEKGTSVPFSMKCDAVILACGSKAAPKTGSDGSGYTLAKQLGHRIIPIHPALVQLRSQGDFLKGLAGVRCMGTVSLWMDGREQAKERGELQLTEYGISGIPVFQVSRIATKALAQGKAVWAKLNFLPDMPEKEAKQLLGTLLSCPGHDTPMQWLSGLLPAKLIPVVLHRMGITERQWDNVWKGRKGTSALADELYRQLSAFALEITGSNAYDQAQVCAGGVDTAELDETFQSKWVPRAYLVGELLDVDGICGGYNLHFAWGSGIAAGRAAAHSKNGSRRL